MTELQGDKTVDLRADLHAIKQKYGAKFYMDRKATREAAALWDIHCNENGVLDRASQTVRVDHRGYSATIELYETGEGYWLVSMSFNAPDEGFGIPASVWDCIAFKDECAARRHAVERILNSCHRRLDREGASAHLSAFMALLKAELTPQLTLF